MMSHEQLHRYIFVINNESFNPTVRSAHLGKLNLHYTLMQLHFSRVFCEPASYAPVVSSGREKAYFLEKVFMF